MITFLSMWLLFCLAALVGSLSTIRKLNAENNALRDQLEAQADTLIGYDKTLHDYNDSCNFEPK